MSSNTPKAPKAVVMEPQSKDDRTDVKAIEIPLPPPEMWKDLDNSSGTLADPASAAAPAIAQVEAEIEELEFLGDVHQRQISLQYPFRFKGNEVHAITVQRLRIGDVDRFIQRARGGSFSTFDIYAAMTGLPVGVLRGLIDVDGDAVTEACFDFLPPSLKPEPEPSAN